MIYRTMAECGLTHDEGPDVGGPVAPYIQSERRDTYGKYARLLVFSRTWSSSVLFSTVISPKMASWKVVVPVPTRAGWWRAQRM